MVRDLLIRGMIAGLIAALAGGIAGVAMTIGSSSQAGRAHPQGEVFEEQQRGSRSAHSSACSEAEAAQAASTRSMSDGDEAPSPRRASTTGLLTVARHIGAGDRRRSRCS